MKKKLSNLRSETEALQERFSLAEDTNRMMKEKYELGKEELDKKVNKKNACNML